MIITTISMMKYWRIFINIDLANSHKIICDVSIGLVLYMVKLGYNEAKRICQNYDNQ
jgi:hypothetical protein